MTSAALTSLLPTTLANAPTPGAKVVIGLSGGVDSAVAALCLRENGFDVQALFMKNWEEDDHTGYCSAAEDLADATAICDVLGIPLATVNLSFEYWERVFAQFLAEYGGGRTPNPDVLCNQEIKFHAFLEHAQSFGATRIATGHYAGLAHRRDRWHLVRAEDTDKDQTYFLHTLNQHQLATAMFPLQQLSKTQVRHVAREAGLTVHDKADSTGICFIGERSMKDFLGRYLDFEPGPIVNLDGEVLGEHQGLPVYTIGQRRGLQIGGRRGASGKPWYVAEKRTSSNELLVVDGNDHPALMSHRLKCSDIVWSGGNACVFPLYCQAQIRHRQPAQPCVVRALRSEPEDGATPMRFEVCFEHAQRAIAPGQAVVFYQARECLGGAIIETAS